MKGFRILHRLSRRLRIAASALVKSEETGYILEILLRKHPAIQEVRLIPEIGGVVILYDPDALPESRLLALLEHLLARIAAAPPAANGARPIVEGNPAEHTLAIEGMSCAACALLIELKMRRDPRVHAASVNFASATLTLRGVIDREGVAQAVRALGYTARSMDTLSQRRFLAEREKTRVAEARRRAIRAAWLSLPVVVSGMAMHHSSALRLVEFALSSAILSGSGQEIFKKAWALARQGEANMDTLIALGAGAAWAYSLPGLFDPRRHVYFESAAGIIVFVLLGRFLEERAKGKAGEAIRKLIELQPETALRLDNDGLEHEVPIDDILPGERLRVRAGARVPLDGQILEGRSALDESLLTGESRPVSKGPGDPVTGGAINGNGSFTMTVTAAGENTVLAGIVRLVDQAQNARLPVQKLADRISARFVPAVGGVAALTFAGWSLAGIPAASALAHAVAVLLIACPCALGLATPTAIMAGTGQAARRGIYIRHGEALETAATLSTIVFDKTGTLTEGRPVVTDAFLLPGENEARLAALIAAAEAGSEHFLGRALIHWCRPRMQETLTAEDFAALPGQGVQARVGGIALLIGNAALLESAGVVPGRLAEAGQRWARQGKTPVFVAVEGHPAALFAITDPPRPGAKAAIARLHRLGVRTLMATGDLEAVARHVADETGIEAIVAHATPAKKLELIRELQATGEKVGMIGDGINDAPALAAADVGFAIGGGADIALEAAGITLVGGDIARVAAAIALSRRTLAIVRQNLFWALGYNVIAIPAAAAGRLNPMIAAAAMAMSSVSVVTNSLRLQREGKPDSLATPSPQ